MDGILKTHFDSFLASHTLPPELASLKGYSLFDDAALLEEWRNWRKGLVWKDDSGNVLRGAVDNILQKDGKLVVLDYKTRGYPLKDDSHEYYIDQMNLYSYLLLKNGHSVQDYAYLLFYHPDKVNGDGSVIFKTDLIKIDTSIAHAENLLKRALDVLSGDMPEMKECEFCRFSEI